MGVMTYAHQKSHLDPVYIPLVRRARQLTRKIMPYAIINGSFDVIKSLALNTDPRFTEEQVSLVIAGAFIAMGEIRRIQGGKPTSMYHWTLPRARNLPTVADSTVKDGAVQPSQSRNEHGVPEILLEEGYRTDGRSPEAVSSPSSAQQFEESRLFNNRDESTIERKFWIWMSTAKSAEMHTHRFAA